MSIGLSDKMAEWLGTQTLDSKVSSLNPVEILKTVQATENYWSFERLLSLPIDAQKFQRHSKLLMCRLPI